ncbi:PREDICTED: uncharacterized protein LOC108564771 [Nicrophorus vespilloides]|uniref:Uncharacterized protein LOC108564771 n=1 Tax=Nicrophorus vespilloides TaxID=110193 RepID=A0ABM1MXS4_NICVS|nr:PREDICTED: uncharacterized protein LOC108564771 [Nicrophorus vespilloides]XP_017779374.1 PREDICTED: uncharacterized protein LOC108564771 [Nicrophorus vespilloides]
MSKYRNEKYLDLFESKVWSDCTFIIDDEKIKAHRFLLACTSPVFESMFYGDMASNEVIIADIDSDIFNKTLQYIYTEKLCIESVLEAWNLVYVSQKYFLLELQALCTTYIENNLSINNLLLSYEYAMLYNQKVLLDKCLDDILLYSKGVLLYSNYHLRVSTLLSILKAAKGNSTNLLMLAISWGLEECAIQGIPSTKDNIYSLFKKYGILDELHFKEFKFFYNDGIFKPLSKEQIFLLENIVELSRELYMDCGIPFETSIYNKLGDKWKQPQFKLRMELKDSQCLPIYQNELLSPTVYCNKDCLVFGVAVSTKSQPAHVRSSSYIGGANIYIYVKHEKNLSHLIFQYENQENYLPYGDIQRITFPVPVLFEAYKEYLICIEYEKGESILLKYMYNKLYKNKSESTVIQFIDEGCGSVLRGLCFYEV